MSAACADCGKQRLVVGCRPSCGGATSCARRSNANALAWAVPLPPHPVPYDGSDGGRKKSPRWNRSVVSSLRTGTALEGPPPQALGDGVAYHSHGHRHPAPPVTTRCYSIAPYLPCARHPPRVSHRMASRHDPGGDDVRTPRSSRSGLAEGAPPRSCGGCVPAALRDSSFQNPLPPHRDQTAAPHPRPAAPEKPGGDRRELGPPRPPHRSVSLAESGVGRPRRLRRDRLPG